MKAVPTKPASYQKPRLVLVSLGAFGAEDLFQSGEIGQSGISGGQEGFETDEMDGSSALESGTFTQDGQGTAGH